MASDTYEARKIWREVFTRDIAVLIAAHLRELEPAKNWHIIESDHTWGPRFSSDDGEQFSLSLDDHKRRVNVYPTYGETPDGRQWSPNDANCTDERPGISGDKAPESIARDIVRRFLPAYRVCLEVYRERCTEQARFFKATADLARDIIDASGGALKHENYRHADQRDKSEIRLDFVGHPQGVSYGYIRVSEKWVRLEGVSGDADFGRRFAAFLRGGK